MRGSIGLISRPVWRAPDRMLGAVLANAGSGSAPAVTASLFLAHHVEVVWR